MELSPGYSIMASTTCLKLRMRKFIEGKHCLIASPIALFSSCRPLSFFFLNVVLVTNNLFPYAIGRYWDLVWSKTGSTGTTGTFDVYAHYPVLMQCYPDSLFFSIYVPHMCPNTGLKEQVLRL